MRGVAEIKSRIGSVRDTLKITKAMYVIAAAKMPTYMANLAAAQRYLGMMQTACGRLMCPQYRLSPYLMGNGDAQHTGYIVVAGGKGLCGDYNDRVLNAAWERIAATPDSKVFTVGYIAKSFFDNKGVRSSTAFLHMMQSPLPEDAAQIADRLMNDLLDNKLGKVYVIYTAANKLHDQQVVCEQLLPLDLPEQDTDVTVTNPDEDVAELIRSLLAAKIYCILTEAAASLNYKHMTGMQTAAKNGEEMLAELTMNYNHARQAAITAELNDVNVSRMANEDKL